MPELKITIIGGGSFSWAPQLIRDFAITPELVDVEVCLHDIDPDGLALVYQLGLKIFDLGPLTLRITQTADLDEALARADFVILTIATGGLNAMQADLEIPEKFGVYHSVGDTVGPGGLARALRTIPVAIDIARRMESVCPEAWLLNYTNPMSAICRAVTRETAVRTIGLCHEFSGVRRHLAGMFGVEPADIEARIAGINHLVWICDLFVNDLPVLDAFGAYAGRVLSGDLQVDPHDTSSFTDQFRVKSLLYQTYGVLPAAGDRHIAEFFPYFLNESGGKGAAYGIRRTSIDERWAIRDELRAMLERLVSGEQEFGPFLREDPGEAAPRIVAALLGGKPYRGPINLPNSGQVSNLPPDAVVETMATVERGTVRADLFGDLPPAAAAVTALHIANQELIVEAALNGSREMALQALVNDPMVHDINTAPQLLDELLAAHQAYLPRFNP